MTSIEEQARAEAEKRRYLFTTPDEDENLRSEFVAGAVWAATRTRVVTTVDQLDALPLGSAVLDADGDVWQMRERGLIPGSEWACTERAIPMSTGAALANAPFAPFRVLYDPEETR